MTCRQMIAVQPALEADKQRLPRVQHGEQPLSAGEPSVLGLGLELTRQKADLLLSGSGAGHLGDGSTVGGEANRRDRKVRVFRTYYQVIHRPG